MASEVLDYYLSQCKPLFDVQKLYSSFHILIVVNLYRRECLSRGQFERGCLALAWSKHFLDGRTPPWLCLIWLFSGYLDSLMPGSLLDLAPYNPWEFTGSFGVVAGLTQKGQSACRQWWKSSQTSWIKPSLVFNVFFWELTKNALCMRPRQPFHLYVAVSVSSSKESKLLQEVWLIYIIILVYYYHCK